MKYRRPVLHVVLMLLLLLSQQMGMSHAVTHFLHSAGGTASSALPGGPATQQERTLPGDLQCIKCLAFASIGSGLVDAAPPRFADPESGSHQADGTFTSPLPSPIRAFDSRAPPVFC